MSAKPSKLGKKVGNRFEGFLSVAEAAKQLKLSERTARQWCESGKLPAIHQPFGTKTRYFISPATIELFKVQSCQEKESKQPAKKKAAISQNHPFFLPAWKKAMGNGLMGGKVFSNRTITIYTFYAEPFVEKHKRLSIETLKAELTSIPAESFSKRLKLYESLVCFAKLLISEGALDKSFLIEAKSIRPKRHIPPKRLTVTASGLEALHKACETTEDKALLLLLVNTGLRASECCALKLEDIDLELGILTVKCGKGGKTRKVGLNPKVGEVLIDYLKEHPKPTLKQYLFLNTKGKQLDRHGLFYRMEQLGERAGIEVSPHALRRAFVTINANAGRPLQMLQMACGHSDIKTTMGYCRTSEQEMITAMKDW